MQVETLMPSKARPDVRLEAAVDKVDGAHALHLMAHGHAPTTQDALVRIAHERRRRQIERVVLLKPAVAVLAHAQLARHLGQLAVLVALAHQTIVGVIGNQKLGDIAANRLHAGRTRAHLLSVFGLERAARLQARHTFDFDQAHAACGFRLASPVERAQVRNLDARPRGGREHGLAWRELNFFSVDNETHTLALSSVTR
jgi:hypothetical protein